VTMWWMTWRAPVHYVVNEAVGIIQPALLRGPGPPGDGVKGDAAAALSRLGWSVTAGSALV
jgi:hypothetical protein